MLQSAAPVLFESSGHHAVLQDQANDDWVALIHAIDGPCFDSLARRYYLALHHFRSLRRRPALPGQIEISAQGKQMALQGMLQAWEQRKAAQKHSKDGHTTDVFVETLPKPDDQDLPEALKDFARPPPPMGVILGGAGRPPEDALCLLRAFLAAPLLGVGDDPTSVYRLLHSNPALAHLCGFLGGEVVKQPGELTSRRLPSLSVCEEFTEIMTRYGLWHHARQEQVRSNLTSGVVKTEDTVSFDTTHIEAHSHCGNVIPADAKVDKDDKPKHRKIPRMRKRCDCLQEHWDTCEHPWVPTDQGAAVVVKGPTRIYWAHKASVATFGDSEIPFDVRVCQYAAMSDGKTLAPHLELLERDLPEVVNGLRYILADDAYRDNHKAVERFGKQARLLVPVHGRKSRAALADTFDGINRFTPTGVPVCDGEHRFELRGRDLIGENFIWVAPDDDQGQPVCAGCPISENCLTKGQRRHIRVNRADQLQIDWDHPQHFAKERLRYAERTGVERSIKRLKVDLRGEHLTHRDSHRVQAHLDRKLLILHLLLAIAASP